MPRPSSGSAGAHESRTLIIEQDAQCDLVVVQLLLLLAVLLSQVEAAFGMSTCAAVSSNLISSLSLRYFFLFAISSFPLRCAAMSPVKSPWHLASINLAIDRTRDIWNTNRFWSPLFMRLRALAMS
jgi:hypothetical protein